MAAESAEREQRERRRRIQIAAIAGFAVLVVVAIVLATTLGGEDEGTSEGEASEVVKLFDGIPQEGTVLGEPDAPFTLTEFADPQCPFCAQFSTDVLPVLIEDYVRPGELKLDLQLLTFIGEDSEEAARFALGLAPQGLFWQFMDLEYANQGAENSGYVDEDFLRELTDQIPGADFDEASTAADSEQVSDALADASSLAQANEINSTPSFLIAKGDQQPEALPIDSLDPAQFTAALDQHLAEHK